MKIRIGIFLFLGILLGACNEHKVVTDVPGCTDPNSINYNPEATVDDGTCLVPQKKQIGFVLEYTATWCGPCGNWGAPQMHEIYKLGNVVGITCHADGDPMYNSALYSSFSSARPDGGGIPSFWVGDVSDADVGDMESLLTNVPEAGIAFAQTIANGKLEVKTITQFFKNVSGEYYLSVYCLESGIDGSATAMDGDYIQNGTTDAEYKHDFVLRACATSSAYGEAIATGNIQEGAQIRKDYTINIDPSWTNNVYAAAVLWKKDANGMYNYVNAFELGSHISH